MAGEYRITGTATVEALERVHGLFASITEPLSPTDHMLFETAVVEVIGNVIAHGRPRGEVRFDLMVEVRDHELVAVVNENGQDWPADMNTVMPGESAESGRGLPLLRAVLDELKFRREGDWSVWTLRRHRA